MARGTPTPMSNLEADNSQPDPLRKALEPRFEGLDQPGQVARATLALWAELAVRLTPIIGLRGLDALLSRSLHLTSLVYPWLGFPGAQGEADTLLGGLGARLEGQETAAAAAASLSLFLNLRGLIAGLIGESLTDRLLAPVWASPPRASHRSIP